MSVKINQIKETTCLLYDDIEEFVGEIRSYLELNDVRLQIKGQKLEGYYLLWQKGGNIVIPIDKNGSLKEWPRGFFDELDNQLEQLIDW